MQQANGSQLSGNINLGLNFLTIDDVILRVIATREPDFRKISERDYKITYREMYGREVFRDKVVIIRSDLNTSVYKYQEGWGVKGKDRLKGSVPTIKEMAGYGAKVIVITHQGAVDKEDRISLDPHKRVLEDLLGKKVIFESGHWYGASTVDIINNMKPGDVFLLDNIRFLADEVSDIRDPNKLITMPYSYMAVHSKLAQFYVNDAFSTSHRWQGSIIGFPNLLNIAGRLTEKEIRESRNLSGDINHPYTLLLGGVKIADYIDFIEDSLENRLVDNILAAGALGILAAMAVKFDGKQINLGEKTNEFLRENELYQLRRKVAGLARDYGEKLVVPADFKVEFEGKVQYMVPEEIHWHPQKDSIGIYGIGPKTVQLFKEKLSESKTIYVKGSPTKDDDERFLQESKQLIDEVVELKNRGVTTILCGGDTNSLVSKFGYSSTNDFTYFTLAGGATTEYLAGNVLPGLLMLNISYNSFWGLPLNSGLPDGYNVGFKLTEPKLLGGLLPYKR